MEVLTKEMITRWILPHLPARTGGRRAAADPAERVRARLQAQNRLLVVLAAREGLIHGRAAELVGRVLPL